MGPLTIGALMLALFGGNQHANITAPHTADRVVTAQISQRRLKPLRAVFAAAAQELEGVKTFGNHVKELRDFANGLRNSTIRLKRMIGNDALSAELRAQAAKTLGTASKLRDAITTIIGK